MVALRLYPNLYLLFTLKSVKFRRTFFSPSSSILPHTKPRFRNLSMSAKSIEQNDIAANLSSTWVAQEDSPLSGLDDVVMGYMFGKKKATEVAHSVWKHVVQKGDAVVDATCGNGYDTLAMLKMVADQSKRGRVYGMDVQKVAIESTSSLLDQSVNSDEKELVELYSMCHSKMEEIVPKGVTVRLVAFNLGYLPGGNKKIMTGSKTTLLALDAAKRILAPGGLISIVVYVGHPGGREEFEAVQAFASGLPVGNWMCCKLEMLNRPLAPVLVLLLKRKG
ncbi:unnamed protein product [Ilex paraguariensis]|uniref:rRNA methylase YtqB n=1 Tax=Ilex paraguariensis TaxID=185542 RepID=A0ABC8U0Z6_9AQUA